MNRLIRTFKSLFAIVELNFKRSAPDIIFYYPQYFNRGTNGSNDFLKPLIDSCDKNNISYLIFEEPVKNGQVNNDAIPFDSIFYLILILRKFLPLKNYDHFDSREWRIARLLKAFFFSKMNPKVVITMSNSMLGFFRGWNNNMPIYDYQHGIVYSWHPGYIIDKKPAPHILNNKSKILLFGVGFKELLVKGNEYYLKNSICLGTGIHCKKNHRVFNRKVLLTLPIVSNNDFDQSQKDVMEKLELLFLHNQSFYIEHSIIFNIKHHPRFDGFYDLSTILRFPFVYVTSKTLAECLNECSLHITHNSTTTFEAAVLGIPTLFLANSHENLLFKEEFGYPSYDACLNIQYKIDEFMADSLKYNYAVELVQEWVKDYYEAFNENGFLELMNEKG